MIPAFPLCSGFKTFETHDSTRHSRSSRVFFEELNSWFLARASPWAAAPNRESRCPLSRIGSTCPNRSRSILRLSKCWMPCFGERSSSDPIDARQRAPADDIPVEVGMRAIARPGDAPVAPYRHVIRFPDPDRHWIGGWRLHILDPEDHWGSVAWCQPDGISVVHDGPLPVQGTRSAFSPLVSSARTRAWIHPSMRSTNPMA
jgi:hypothetical protein